MSEAANHIAQPGQHVEAEKRLAGVPHILLPYQQVWVADDAPLKICEKSRRIGISWAEAADAALHASTQSGSDVFYLAYNQDMTRQFIEDAAWWAKWYDLAASEINETVLDDGDKEIKVFEISFSSGHKIQALSSKPRNLRSKQGRVIFDEFAFHDDPDGLLKAAIALRVWGGEVRIISTHNGIDNAFNRLIEEIRAGRRPGSVHRVTFEEAVDQGLYERICLIKGWEWSSSGERMWMQQIYAEYGDDASEELDAIPAKGGGKYFSRVLVEDCMDASVPVLRWKLNDEFAQLPEARRERLTTEWLEDNLKPVLDQLNPQLKSFLGDDFGRSGDLSYILVAQLEADLTRRSAFGLELRNVPHTTQLQVVRFIIQRLPRFTSAAFDASGNGSFLAEATAQDWGWDRIHQIKLSSNWYLEHFPRYRAGVQDRKVLLPADVDLLDDHSDVEFVAGIPRVPDSGRRKGTDDGQRHGDGAVAACLMWFASEQDGPAIPVAASTTYSQPTTPRPVARAGTALIQRFRRYRGGHARRAR